MPVTVLEQKKEAIAALCQKHRVRLLWVFRSATTDAWDPATSDIDFLVDLGEYSEDYARRFLSLRRELTSLLGCDVDLVSVGGLGADDDWLRKEIESTRVELYDARRDQLVA